MNNIIEEIVLTVFKKDLASLFTSFNKSSYSDHISSLQTELNNSFQSNITQTSFSQLQTLTTNNNLVSNAGLLKSTCQELLNLRYSLYQVLIDKIGEAKLKHLEGGDSEYIKRDYTDGAFYIGKETDSKRIGLGYYTDKDEGYIFFGEWEDDQHKNGILLTKKEKQSEIFIGHFQFTGNSYLFNGLFLSVPHNPSEVTTNTLSFAYGNFEDNQKVINGVICFSNGDNSNLDIYLGKLEEFKKNDENAVLINFVNNEVFFYSGGFTADSRSHSGLIYKSDQYLLQLTHGSDNKLEKATSAFLRLHDKSLFNGEILIEGDFQISLGGSGTHVFNNNNFYQGGFLDGKKEGKGQYFIRDAANVILFTFEVTFKQDQMVNGSILKNIQGNLTKVFEGDFLNNAPSNGKYFYENGEVYEGQLVNNAREGRGRYNYSDNCYYEGEWKSNLKHGKGKYVDVENNVFEAIWQNNHLTQIENCTTADEDN